MNNIVNFYKNSDEESRLTTNNARKVEFAVTTTILNQHIKAHSTILELGAGTGVYSFYYADRGNNVLATDITQKHVDIINKKLSQRENSINLSAEVADATILSNYESESFDVVLNLGPMYHLTNENDREKCRTDNFFTTPIDIENFISRFGIEIIDHVGTDGISPMISDFIDSLNAEEYSTWLNYCLASCREKSILGMSNHGLIICKK